MVPQLKFTNYYVSVRIRELRTDRRICLTADADRSRTRFVSCAVSGDKMRAWRGAHKKVKNTLKKFYFYPIL
jgi:hypothetical protein